jgi:hypothetical protein
LLQSRHTTVEKVNTPSIDRGIMGCNLPEQGL